MLLIQRIPRLLRWVLSVVILFLLLMTIFRFIFFWTYNPPGRAFSGSAFIMGFRYDARYACAIGLIILILCAFRFLNPFKNAGARKFWNFFLPFLFVIILIFYGADFYHYDYLHKRLNASVLNFLQDAGISGQMMWESYPVIRILLLLIVLAIAGRFVFGRLLHLYITKESPYKRRGIGAYAIFILLFAIAIVGRVVVKGGQFPLRWSDAYQIGDDYKANLALNPLQSFLSTLKFRNTMPDINKVKSFYSLMSDHLKADKPDSITLSFERYHKTAPAADPPNIVLVICESFSAYKSSMWGNPLNTTPYFKQLCDSGVFFDRCFTPSWGTARGVWATLTGIPDVQSPKDASRNSANVDQHIIINELSAYQKFYFLGGSASWANIRGVLTNNIAGLHLYEKENYKAKELDVWGISDKNLFLEANNVLKQQQKPFFAVIQTADNHRPYSIPSEDKEDFKELNLPKDMLSKYGFENNAEMNAFRFTDFCYQHFIEAAKKERYFDNTIFVFIGDHGISGNAGDMMPQAFSQQQLVNEHVPLLFYSPKLLRPKRIHDVCSQVDVLPSIASLAGASYHNYTMGRDIFANDSDGIDRKNAFIIDPDKSIGMVNDQYYFLKNMKSGGQQFVSIVNNDPVPVNRVTDSIKNYLNRLTDAYYETSKYMLQNNKKKYKLE